MRCSFVLGEIREPLPGTDKKLDLRTNFGPRKNLFPPGLEPGTFRVLGERDNHYTTETWKLIKKLFIKLTAIWSDANGTYSSPVFSPEKVVDTIGAGDSFVGATIGWVLDGVFNDDF